MKVFAVLAAVAGAAAAADQCGTAEVWKDGKCAPCGPGRVVDTTSSYTEGKGYAACKNCEYGSVKSPAGNNQKNAECVFPGGEGYLCTGSAEVARDGVCVTCGPGRVTDPENPKECKNCDPGYVKYPPGNTSKDAICIPVGPGVSCGSAEVAEDGVCKPCGPGRVAKTGAACDDCPLGSVKFPPGGNQVNAVCISYGSPGYFCGTAEVAQHGVCAQCGPGRVAANGSQCKNCEDNTVKFPAGGYQVNAKCVPYGSDDYFCGTGQIARGGACVDCGTNRVAVCDHETSTCVCQDCLAGTHKVTSGDHNQNAECVV